MHSRSEVNEFTEPVHRDRDRRTREISREISDTERNQRSYENIHLCFLGDGLAELDCDDNRDKHSQRTCRIRLSGISIGKIPDCSRTGHYEHRGIKCRCDTDTDRCTGYSRRHCARLCQEVREPFEESSVYHADILGDRRKDRTYKQ